MAKKGNDSNASAERTAMLQRSFAEKMIKQTDPIRSSLIFDAQQFLNGDRDVTGLPEYQSGFRAADAQYGRARDNIIGSTPEGGGLTAALAGLEQGRADNLTNLSALLSGQEMERATSLGTFGATTGTSGLGQAGLLQAQLAQSQAQQNAGKSQGLGTAIGTAAGFAVGGKPGAAAGGRAGGSAGGKVG